MDGDNGQAAMRRRLRQAAKRRKYTLPAKPPIKTRPEGEGDGWSADDRGRAKALKDFRERRNCQQPL